MNPTDIPHTDNPSDTPQGDQTKSAKIPLQPSPETPRDSSQGNQSAPSPETTESKTSTSPENSPSNPQSSTTGTSPENSQGNTSGTSPENSQSSTSGTSPENSQGSTSGTSPENSQDSTSGTSPENSQDNIAGTSPDISQSDPQDISGKSSSEVHATALELPDPKSARKIAVYAAIAIAAVLLLVYLGVSFYFRSHFLFHTAINGQDFSCQTVEDARTFFEGEAAIYDLQITESGGKTENIFGSEINMVWDDSLALDRILENQNAFAWPIEYFKEKSEEITFDISYDDSALEKAVRSLNAVTAEPIQPQSAYPEFDGNAYVIKPEVYGTEVDFEKLLDEIRQSVAQLDDEINLQEEGFYKAPQYTAESKELKDVCSTLNQYCKASITYEMDVPVVVDKTLISTWLSVDKDFHITLDEAAVRNWMTEFGRRYDTLGTTRPLTTPTGKATEVSGGTYGWTINEDEEFPALLNSIKNGEILTKAPACLQTAASHSPQDWGGTFVEVDLTTQHMWYLENGTVVFESDVVTGKNSTSTPPGVYTILEKLSPTVLVGNMDPVTKEPEYRTPVTFWMRVTWSGIGFHDANWQPAFGGDVYLWNGSHGCINMPYYGAQEFYSMIQLGTPVVIHF